MQQLDMPVTDNEQKAGKRAWLTNSKIEYHLLHRTHLILNKEGKHALCCVSLCIFVVESQTVLFHFLLALGT